MSDSEGSEGEEVNFDPDDLEDDEDGFDEFEDEEAGRSAPKRPRNEFILDEAEVDDDVEDDEDDEEEEGFSAFIKQDDGRSKRPEKDASGMRRIHQMLQRADEDDEAEIEKYYRSKYAETQVSERFRDFDEETEEISQQSLLPGVKDPNLWTIKCRPGSEKETAIHLMRKFLTMENSESPLQIKSVVVPEGLKGYIYIESFKQTHVKQAIDGVSNLKLGFWKQQMVPINEMTDVMKVVKDIIALRTGAWVRLKRGIYRDDLARVEQVDPTRSQVILKMIPRIDYSRQRGVAKSSEDPQRKRHRVKPAPKLFDENKVREIGGEITKERDYWVFEGNRYKNGFMYKPMAMSALVTEGVKPSLSELEKFQATPETAVNDLYSSSKSGGSMRSLLTPGDTVIVGEGELINLQGTVMKMEGNIVTIIPNHEDLKDPLEFPAHELKKHFKLGDHVKVIMGQNEGDTGLIVRIENNLAVLVSDLTLHELKVRPRDLQLCSERSSGVDSSGHFQFGDLVQLDQQTVGVIVRIEHESFVVLNMHGKVLNVRQQAVNKKNTRNAVALDSEQNNIQAKDVVKVTDGPHAGRQGEIRHIYRNWAFLQSKSMIENGGIFAVKTRHVALAGGSRAPSSTPAFVAKSPRISSPAHPSSGGGRGRVARGRGRRDHEIIGQTVRISQGPYKGYIGIVKDATESTARVELHTKCQTISVDRTRLVTIGDQRKTGLVSAYQRTPMYNLGSQTPMYGSQTPMYGAGGGRTPMYGSQTPTQAEGGRTPHYGSQTPVHDPSRTPSHYGVSGSNAWDPREPNTPKRPDEFGDYGFSSSPSPQGFPNTPSPATPGGGFGAPQTPGTYAPETPQSAMPFTPGTPLSAGMYSHEPAYSPYVQTPSPAFNPLTPGGPMSPATPAGLYNPQTPGAALEQGMMIPEWMQQDVEVQVTDAYENPEYANQLGVVKNVSGGMCAIYLYEEEQDVTLPVDCLGRVAPAKQDKVKVVGGNCDRGCIGSLINIDGEDGIVKITATEQLRILPLQYLAKITV
ncbi:transcription elongation factor SPT5-like [Corticium candelabrum]|uniref:transcription elongation factor SPT5-like n=1 Tax=Corticium candelabrum TaxID=121492 RepID=UPI002E254BB0|nr:transcription elongation factor SPT5-like [Corticium candelabrum]